MFGLNQRDIKLAMKKMGLKEEEIKADEVIIKSNNKMLIIKNPHVSKVEFMGEKTFQISGNIEEKEVLNDKDIDIIMEQVKCTREEAENALKSNKGELAKAILWLQNK